MVDTSDLTKTVVNEEERKRLINEITNIKDVLDSFKYGLNFEEFADVIFKTINRQTITTKSLESKMDDIIQRMEQLESALDEGIKVRLSGFKGSMEDVSEEIIIEKPETRPEEVSSEELAKQVSREELEQESDELSTKIAKLFEKENELLEMGLNDPAGAEEYEEKAAVAKSMRSEHEASLKEIKEKLK